MGPSVIPTVMPWLAGKASQPLTLSLSYVYSGEASEAGQRRRPEHIHVRCLSVPFVTLQVLTYGFVALAQCTATTPELNPPPPPHLTPNGFLVSVSRASGANPFIVSDVRRKTYVCLFICNDSSHCSIHYFYEYGSLSMDTGGYIRRSL